MAASHYSETTAVTKAISLRDTGQLAASLSLLHVACDEDPENSMAWHQLGIGYVRAGNIGHAQRCLQRAADLAPDSVAILSHLANVLVLKKDTDSALELARKLVALNPGAAEVHLFLGNLYASTGQLDNAEHCIRAALERAPGMAAAHLLLARVLLAGRRQLAGAHAAVSNALLLEPENTQARQVLEQIESLQS